MITVDRCIGLVQERAISVLPDAVIGDVMPCELCGLWTSDFEHHHRKFRSRRGGWTASNILLLCRDDHALATAELAKPGVNVASWEQPEWVPVQLWYTDSPVLLDNDGGYSPCCPVA